MRSIQVRGVPEDTHRALRLRAAEEGKSLQEYVLSLLNDHARRPTVAEVLRQVGDHHGGSVGLQWAAEHLRAERDHR